MRRSWFALACTVVALATMAQPAGAAAGFRATRGVVAPQGSYHGASYGSWSAAWWQWLLNHPVHVGATVEQPAVVPPNPDGSAVAVNCSYGQSGTVWFLAGTFNSSATTVNRTCVVPRGTALFVPVIDAFESENGTVDQMRADTAAFINSISSMSFTIDGRNVVGLSTSSPYRVISPGTFTVTLPADNVYGDPTLAGSYAPTVADGVYVLLAPLAPGVHTLHWTGTSPTFTQDITYAITVTS